MARDSHRISRLLIVLLAVALVLGIVAVLHKPTRLVAAETLTPPPVAILSAAPTTAPAAMISTPIVLASTNPPTNGDAPAAPLPPHGDGISPPNQLALAQNAAAEPPITQSPTTAPSASLTTSGGSAIDQAKADIAADKLLEARAILNNSLLSGDLASSDINATKTLMSQLNDTIIFSPRKFGDDPYGGCVTVAPGETMAKLARENDMTWELLSRINNVDPKHLRAGATLKVVKGPFHVVVTKSTFTMDVYLGSAGGKDSMYIRSYPVGLGRDDSTPPGTWMVEVHRKIKHPTYYSPRGEGVIAANDPKNPLGPFWIGLTGIDGQAVGKMSYGIHGTIEPDSIGKQSSMGCIRMHNEDVAIVFELLVEGRSTVIVKP